MWVLAVAGKGEVAKAAEVMEVVVGAEEAKAAGREPRSRNENEWATSTRSRLRVDGLKAIYAAYPAAPRQT